MVKLQDAKFQMVYKLTNISRTGKPDSDGYYSYSVTVTLEQPYKRMIRKVIIKEKTVERVKSYLWTHFDMLIGENLKLYLNY